MEMNLPLPASTWTPKKGICQEFYGMSCSDPADEFHGIDIWPPSKTLQKLVGANNQSHYLSQVDTWLTQQSAQACSPASGEPR